MNPDPYRQAHPRRTDWLRVAQYVGGAIILAAALWAGIALTIAYVGGH